MSVRIVDLNARNVSCYSNAVHHNELDDTYSAAAVRTTSRIASELVTQYYLSSIAEKAVVASQPSLETVKAGTKLLQLVKQRVSQKISSAA